MAKLTASEVQKSLASMPGWMRKGGTIRRTYEFADFAAALKFVVAAGRAAEKAWHHPDIDIRWNKVTLALTTHDEGGLTPKDLALARTFDTLAG